MAHVRFDNVSKIYSRQSRQFFWRFLLQRSGRAEPKPIYALRDVSFDVSNGQSLGIIGHNGAGKSTLLSLVAGLTTPERGGVDVEGHVMALLELGSGFHHDLSGVENLRLNAAFRGFTKQETAALQERIIDFAELGDFIDEPLRTYSQGMILRLAFAIAVHVDPDILLLDEVLVVGDKDFQKKCFDRILQMKREGKILLCVSHVPTMLQQLCEKALWIESGQVIMQGPIDEVAEEYLTRGAPAISKP
ncbi:MAG: ABC transporter ATP-binding protein [bacterium]|nr:ABC transporter ATP-binding protein [bacterium]